MTISSPQAQAALIQEALKHRRWSIVLCGACGCTYKRCAYCDVGIKAGTSYENAQCGGHRDLPCYQSCLAVKALSALEAILVPSSSPEMKTECCDVRMIAEQRFCPKCGYEARAAVASSSGQEKEMPRTNKVLHWKDGWTFTRNRDGSVSLIDDNGEYASIDIDADSWVSIICAMGAGPETSERHQAIRQFHLAESAGVPPPPRQEERQTAWLIGRVGPEWWTGRGDEWTASVDGTTLNPTLCAIRFSRREDAERAIGWLMGSREVRDYVHAEEHIWG